MEQSKRERIRSNSEKLLKLIDFNELQPHLEKSKIFTSAMLNDIMKADTSRADRRTELMLKSLPKRGPNAYNKFGTCLLESGQVSAAKLLCDALPDSVGVWTGSVTPSVAMRTENSDWAYRMLAKPRGVTLIISIVTFHNDLLDKRVGGEVDEDNLRKLFQDLGFEVDLHQNKTKSEIMKILSDFQHDNRHKKADACIIIVLSHGCKAGFCTADNEVIYNADILEMFNNKKCSVLRGKPKIFFLQHCRGDDYDYKISKDLVPDAMPIPKDFSAATNELTLPMWSDMKICYSTTPGFVAFRNPSSGSIFINMTVEVFSREAHHKHLDEMMQEVTRRMLCLELDLHYKQSTEYTERGWQRKLYFNPGIYE